MQITEVKITPSIAAQWLETVNTTNRPISRSKVNVYADEMSGNTWRNTHQNIIAFYADGVLADGQHRLSAIVKTGLTITMFVAQGLSRADGAAIDQGRPRRLTDALVIGGLVDSSKYILQRVATLRAIRIAETGDIRQMTATATAEKLKLINEGISFTAHHLSSASVGVRNASVRGAISTAYYHVPIAKLERICRVLVCGMPEGQEDAMIIKLRNSLLENASYKARDRIEQYRTVMHFIKAYNEGRDLKVVRRVKDNVFTVGIFDND
jgi:hypothetical protein